VLYIVRLYQQLHPAQSDVAFKYNIIAEMVCGCISFNRGSKKSILMKADGAHNHGLQLDGSVQSTSKSAQADNTFDRVKFNSSKSSSPKTPTRESIMEPCSISFRQAHNRSINSMI
jgi:hypothetical protein